MIHTNCRLSMGLVVGIVIVLKAVIEPLKLFGQMVDLISIVLVMELVEM